MVITISMNDQHPLIHAIVWNKISKPNCEGGLFIRKPEDTNTTC